MKWEIDHNYKIITIYEWSKNDHTLLVSTCNNRNWSFDGISYFSLTAHAQIVTDRRCYIFCWFLRQKSLPIIDEIFFTGSSWNNRQWYSMKYSLPTKSAIIFHDYCRIIADVAVSLMILSKILKSAIIIDDSAIIILWVYAYKWNNWAILAHI